MESPSSPLWLSTDCLLMGHCRDGEESTVSDFLWSLHDIKASANHEILPDVVRICQCEMYFTCVTRIDLLAPQECQRPIGVEMPKSERGAVSGTHERCASPFLRLEKPDPGTHVEHNHLTALHVRQTVALAHEQPRSTPAEDSAQLPQLSCHRS